MSEKDPLVIICATVDGKPLMMPDNRVGECHFCGEAVQYRPHVPKFDYLCCVACAAEVIEPADKISITEETAKEVAALFKRWRQ